MPDAHPATPHPIAPALTPAERDRALVQARAWVARACARLGVPGFADEVAVAFNGRFTARMGDAHLERRLIRLSAPLWPRAGEHEHRRTVLHELCHLVAHARHGRRIRPHGPEWRALMETLGADASRCHYIDRTGLRRVRPRQLARCACRTHALGAVRAERLRRGTAIYRCRHCAAPLRLDATHA